MKQGKLIVLEGADGVGKTTASGHIRAYLQLQGIQTVEVRDLGNHFSGIAKLMRRIIFDLGGPSMEVISRECCFFISHMENQRVCKELRGQGKWVISDRWSPISQLAYGPDKDAPEIAYKLYELYKDTLTKPSIVLVLRAESEVAFGRAQRNRNRDYEQNKKAWGNELSKHYRINARYAELYEKAMEDGEPWKYINYGPREGTQEVFLMCVRPEIKRMADEWLQL